MKKTGRKEWEIPNPKGFVIKILLISKWLKAFVILLFCCGSSLSLKAQDPQIEPQFQIDKLLNKLSNIGAVNYDVPDEFGNYYRRHLFLEEKELEIITYFGDTLKGNFLYDLQLEALEKKESGKIYPFNIVRSFKFVDNNISFSNLIEFFPDSEYGGFVQDWECSQLVKTKYSLIFEVPNEILEGDDFQGQIKVREQNIIVLNDTIQVLPNKNKEFIDLFPNQTNELKTYMRKNRLRLRNDEDLCQIVEWAIKNEN